MNRKKGHLKENGCSLLDIKEKIFHSLYEKSNKWLKPPFFNHINSGSYRRTKKEKSHINIRLTKNKQVICC